MMQLEHDNIIPFYGVSADVSDFCLVFPWYENGNIVDYLSKRPDVNRFVPVSAFEHDPVCSWHLLASRSSYRMQPTDCASCTRII